MPAQRRAAAISLAASEQENVADYSRRSVVKLGTRTWNQSRLVSVFNPQDEATVVFARENMAEKSGAETTQVQGAGRRRSEARANGSSSWRGCSAEIAVRIQTSL
jgi:hypothetical protein